jgi:hypothetical protein
MIDLSIKAMILLAGITGIGFIAIALVFMKTKIIREFHENYYK